MTTVRLRAAFSALAFLSALALLPASASANCSWYVKTALEQQQRNLKMKCGFTGPEWSADRGVHDSWCGDVGPEVSRAMAKKREAELTLCANR